MDIAAHTLPPERIKILLLEDDAAVRRSLQLLLQAQGFDVRAYGNGTMLLADDANLTAECLVADYRLDELDGVIALARLRDRGWRGPAVLITAFPSAELTEQATKAGFEVILEKPLRQGALVGAVKRLTSRDDGKAT